MASAQQACRHSPLATAVNQRHVRAVHLAPKQHHRYRWEVNRGRLKRTVHARHQLVNRRMTAGRDPKGNRSKGLAGTRPADKLRTRPTDLRNALPNLSRIGFMNH
jgi:hypothetical protein